MLERLDEGWYRFHGGRRWRCVGPSYLCEVDDAGHTPSELNSPGVKAKIGRIRAMYAGRLRLGLLDAHGTALDVLIANAYTESYGTVPSPLNLPELERALAEHPELPLDIRLDHMLREVARAKPAAWLVRQEPGYTSPLRTPSRVSAGAHHMLLSTAQEQQRGRPHLDEPATQLLRLLADSIYAAQLACDYLNQRQGRHQNQLPLLAATYNAGSPQPDSRNPWRLRQYGAHIDRWLSFYNASRQAVGASAPPSRPTRPPQATAKPAPSLPLVPALPAGSPVAPASACPGALAMGAVQLSPHFSLAEFTRSDKARQLGISNQPSPATQENLARLAEMMEKVRSLLGNKPLSVSSAYRSEALNRAVGGQPHSQHKLGLAIDFTCPEFGSPLSICRAIAQADLPYDQLIHEFGRWVHLSVAAEHTAPRRQLLTISKAGTRDGLWLI
jgi:hypothetical protein